MTWYRRLRAILLALGLLFSLPAPAAEAGQDYWSYDCRNIYGEPIWWYNQTGIYGTRYWHQWPGWPVIDVRVDHSGVMNVYAQVGYQCGFLGGPIGNWNEGIEWGQRFEKGDIVWSWGCHGFVVQQGGWRSYCY